MNSHKMLDFSDFEKELINTFKTNSKFNAQDKTIHQYIGKLRVLNEKKQMNDLLFLKDTEEIEKKMNTKALKTQKSYCNIIYRALDLLDTMPTEKEYYTNKFKQLTEELNKDSDKKNEKQKDNWVEMKELIDLTFSQKQLVKKEKNYRTALDMMVMALYTLLPPRRALDYIDCYVVKRYTPKNHKNNNYLCMRTNKFYFNNYKTSKKYNTQELSFKDNKEFKSILRLYLKYNNYYNPKMSLKEEVLFLHTPNTNEKLNESNGITIIMNNLTQKELGKKISVNMIRNIYLTTHFADNKKKLIQTTENMGTSSNTANKVYIKNE